MITGFECYCKWESRYKKVIIVPFTNEKRIGDFSKILLITSLNVYNRVGNKKFSLRRKFRNNSTCKTSIVYAKLREFIIRSTFLKRIEDIIELGNIKNKNVIKKLKELENL